MDLDLSVEISALEHVFGPFQKDSEELARARQLKLNLTPYTGDDETLFADMDVTFSMGQQYPDVAPEVEVTSSRGLSDERVGIVMQSMFEEAQQLAGEHMLMSMCMAGKEALSHLNHPEGASFRVAMLSGRSMVDQALCLIIHCSHNAYVCCIGSAQRVALLAYHVICVGACPFCLENMQDASTCMRGACFHGFHSTCFRRWWQWRVKQQELDRQQIEHSRRTIGLGVAVVCLRSCALQYNQMTGDDDLRPVRIGPNMRAGMCRNSLKT